MSFFTVIAVLTLVLSGWLILKGSLEQDHIFSVGVSFGLAGLGLLGVHLSVSWWLMLPCFVGAIAAAAAPLYKPSDNYQTPQED